jgi:hypothetical protein
MKSHASSSDADTARLEEILRGASRGAQDPDLELFAMLAELRGLEGGPELDTALERLARDARPD